MTSRSVSDLAEVRDELHVVARDLLGKAGPGAEPGWDVLAASGWLGIEVPDEFGGADATFAEVAVIAEELGRAATRVPYLGAIVLGAGTLRAAAPGDGRAELLGQVAAGEALAVAVITGGDPAFRLTDGQGGRLRLNGEASFVPDAADASRLLVVAYPGDGVGDPVIVALNPLVPGLAITPTPLLDETRGLAEVQAGEVEVAPEEVWRFSGDPHAAVQRLRDRASVALACDSLGVAQAMLEKTVAYVKVRHQFGRPVGSFQAVKHACADMLVQIAVARELVAAAVDALTEPPEGPGAAEAAASVAASMAKSYTGTAAVDVAGKAMQLHGGVGYAREAGIHTYLKRAALNRDLFGSPIAHRARLASRYRPAAAGS